MQQAAGLGEDEDEEMGVKEEEDDDDEEEDDAEEDGYSMDPCPVAVASPPGTGSGGGGRANSSRRRAREEKERTKLRERQRRAITGRILAGLRQHGNYSLRARADINEVIAALAREAGWVVLPDGTTFPSSPSSAAAAAAQPARPVMVVAAAPPCTPLALPGSPALPLRGISPVAARPISHRPAPASSILLSPPRCAAASRPPADDVVPDGNCSDLLAVPVPMDPTVAEETAVTKQVPEVAPRPPERDFAGTPYVPVYVMLPLGVVNGNGEVVDVDELVGQLRVLKAAGVDGVMVDCWWGNVEAHRPQEYNWTGYKRLFQMIRELKLKLQVRFSLLMLLTYFSGQIAQVVMSFHECGGNVGDDVSIPLPHWVTEIGKSNPDIYFTDRAGRRNTECLSWGIDKERVLQGRTAVEVYFDFMRSFRVEFDEYFEDAIISEIEIGLGACGELRYPSYPAKHGWKYPGIGEFQAIDNVFFFSATTVLKKYDAALNFTCVELRTMDQHEVYPEAFADPEGLVLNAAWDAGIQVASENALPCYDRDGFNKILENAKPLNDPDGRHLFGFTYLRLSKVLLERPNFFEFERFVKRMHGEAVLDLHV
ncbi:Beta-amylase 7 [Dichanthelium oligosanthes]|uniref:Beta-amylase n=1 Tax=Dichanthelium oligosanthes TaxID=888268 RepID=A0A1E5VJ17_9POAL|nr:Beta-amylase 7 [Dichanthelium oligosanthes]